MRFERLHAVHNRGNYVLVPNYRIDHQVIEAARRPVGVEVMFDIRDPFLVHILHQVFCLCAALGHGHHAANLFVVRSIGKDAEGILAFAQEKRAPAADNHRIPFLRNRVHDLTYHGHHAIRIKRVRGGQRNTPFVTAPPEGFRQAVKTAVDTLIAQGHRPFRHLRALRNLARQLLVPQLPPQLASQFAGDASAPAAKFAFDCDDAKHREPPARWSDGRLSRLQPGGDTRLSTTTLLYDDHYTTISEPRSRRPASPS